MPTATIKGLPELKREMTRLDRAVQTRLARNAAMAMARVVAKHARANAPVETGALRASKAQGDRNWKMARGTVTFPRQALLGSASDHTRE